MYFKRATRVLSLAVLTAAAPFTLSAGVHLYRHHPAQDPTQKTEMNEIRDVCFNETKLVRALEELESVSHEPLLISAESHIALLNQAREDLNNAGARLADLTSKESSMPLDERAAIDSTRAALSQVASELQSVIVRFNGNHSIRLRSDYQDEVKGMANAAVVANQSAHRLLSVAQADSKLGHVTT